MDSEVLSSILQSYALPLEEEEQVAVQQCKNEGSSGSTHVPDFVDCDHCASLYPTHRRLQQLVFYVDVSQLDLNFAIRLFTQYRLWTALVHVYCSLKDHISPLELLVGECTQLAKKCQSKLTNGDSARGEAPVLYCWLVRKLFFFLQRCFALRPFPLDAKDGAGMVSPSPSAIPELLACIFKPASIDGKAPPMFMRLLRLSPMCFFGVLSVLYTAPSGSHALQQQQQQGTSASSGVMSAYSPLTLSSLFQAIEDAVEAAREQAAQDGQPLPPHTDAEFLWFIARAAPKAKKAVRPSRCVQVVEHLLTPGGGSSSSSSSFSRHSAEEAQQLLIGVLSAQDTLDKDRRDTLIAKMMQRGFFGAASWLHEEAGEYDRVLDCRLRDDELRDSIFEFIICRLAEQEHNIEHITALVDATLQRLPRLVAIDPERCAACL
jgi:hypothetical protein